MRNAAVCLMAAVLMTSAAPSVGIAQIQFSVSPNVGLYIPHGAPLLEVPANYSMSELRSKKPVGGPVFTTRVAAWLTPHLGLEGNVSYSPAFIAVQNRSGLVVDHSAGLLLSSIRSVFRLPAANDIKYLGVQLGSGVGLVSRSGDAWADTPTDPAFAFVVSAAVRAQLNPRKPLAFRMELEDYISWAQFQLDSGAYSRGRAYHDVIWSLGLVFPLADRR